VILRARIPAVQNLKYSDGGQVARHLGGLLVNRLVEAGVHHDLDVVTWAPTSSRRRRQRGFDQVEEIACTARRQLSVPARRLLAPPGSSTARTGKKSVRAQHRREFLKFLEVLDEEHIS